MAVMGNSGVAKHMLELIIAVSTFTEYCSWYPSHNSTTYKTLLFYQALHLISSEAPFQKFACYCGLKI